MAWPHALVIAGALVGATAHAEVIDLPDTRAQLTLDPRAWRTITATGVVYAATTDRGEHLAVTRAQIPNVDAWRAKARDAYVAQIENGLVAAGYQPTSKKLVTIEGVPVLDLEATIDKRSSTSSKSAPPGSKPPRREPIVMRVILFRTYALALALEGPRSSRTKLRAVAKTFVPPPARPEGSP